MGKFRRSFRLVENTQVRVQRTARLSAAVSDTMELQDTIGDEEAVLVVVDPQELPRTWASVDLLGEQIGEGTYRAMPADVAPDQSVTMGEDWGVQLKASVANLQQTASIKLGEVHLDAKLFPHLRPRGSGSLRAEDDKVSMQEYGQHRLMSLQHDFRQSPVWSFWFLDRLIKDDLYFRNQRNLRRANPTASPDGSAPTMDGRRKRAASAASLDEPNVVSDSVKQDKYEMLFGRVDPRHIPESGGWWKQQQTELMAISDDHEMGLMTSMVTVTQNDLSPELIAHASRGPCAAPKDDEKIAYLLTRRGPSDRRPNIQKDAAAAVLSFQRRTRAVKQNFLVRNKRTPLGVSRGFWDRTEAQTRQALHSHILKWDKRRKLNNGQYRPRPAIPEDHNRCWDASKASNPTMNAEDDVYYRTETARVNAELIRLDLSQEFRWPRETLLWAFLLRAIQTLLYIHACTTRYCLKNRESCRVFLPLARAS